MHRTERAVIYTLLALLTLAALPNLWSKSQKSAFADPASWADMLGPADGVKLADVGKAAEGKELLLQGRDGRISWGESPFNRAYSMAFVDIGRVLSPLMDSESMREERNSLISELETKDKEYREQLDGFRERIGDLDPQSPEAQEIFEEGGKVYEEYMAWSTTARERRSKLDVEQLQKSYKELTAAVDIVAQRLGIDVVFRFIPADKEFNAEDSATALTEIRLRAAVKCPTELDITSEVLEELSLQDTVE